MDVDPKVIVLGVIGAVAVGLFGASVVIFFVFVFGVVGLNFLSSVVARLLLFDVGVIFVFVFGL